VISDTLLRNLAGASDVLRQRFQDYWSLVKSLQTGLLLATGVAGFSSARCPVTHWDSTLSLAGSLLLAISGSTVLNMVYDRDIDALMHRTARRALPSGRVAPGEALAIGLGLSFLGVGWALALAPLYGAIVFAGLFFDVVIYTINLKRRTAYSIIIGGLAGGMPTLAGRSLAAGRIDTVGLLLALAILLWIPTHIMTFSLRLDEDYRRAGIPTFPIQYGVRVTQLVIAVSSLAAAVAMAAAAALIGLERRYLRLLGVLSLGLLGLAASSVFRPSGKTNFGLFKYASFYMLSSMLLIVAEAV